MLPLRREAELILERDSHFCLLTQKARSVTERLCGIGRLIERYKRYNGPVPGQYWADAASIGPVLAWYWHVLWYFGVYTNRGITSVEPAEETTILHETCYKMLPASDQYWPGTGMFCDILVCIIIGELLLWSLLKRLTWNIWLPVKANLVACTEILVCTWKFLVAGCHFSSSKEFPLMLDYKIPGPFYDFPWHFFSLCTAFPNKNRIHNLRSPG